MTATTIFSGRPSLLMNAPSNVNTSNSSLAKQQDDTTIAMDISSSSLDASAIATSRSRRRRRPRVCFSNIDVYTFEQILGDNPAVSNGAPLALAPHHIEHKSMDIGYFEYKRQPRRANRKDLMESKQVREDYLKERGYTADEIEGAATQAANIRRKRDRHLSKQWDKFHVAIENSKKLLRGRKQESATALLKQHQEATRAA